MNYPYDACQFKRSLLHTSLLYRHEKMQSETLTNRPWENSLICNHSVHPKRSWRVQGHNHTLKYTHKCVQTLHRTHAHRNNHTAIIDRLPRQALLSVHLSYRQWVHISRPWFPLSQYLLPYFLFK